MKNISSVKKWPFQHTKVAILRKWGYVLKWPFWGNGGMVANSANSGTFYTILPNIWHPCRSWVRLHMEIQLESWEKFEANLLVWHSQWIMFNWQNGFFVILLFSFTESTIFSDNKIKEYFSYFHLICKNLKVRSCQFLSIDRPTDYEHSNQTTDRKNANKKCLNK